MSTSTSAALSKPLSATLLSPSTPSSSAPTAYGSVREELEVSELPNKQVSFWRRHRIGAYALVALAVLVTVLITLFALGVFQGKSPALFTAPHPTTNVESNPTNVAKLNVQARLEWNENYG